MIKKAYKIAKKENVAEKIKFVQGDILNLKSYRNSFDVVICMRDVLNYTGKDFEKALDNICSTIKKKGYLILSVGTKLHYILSKNLSYKAIKHTLLKGYGIYEGIEVRVFDKKEMEKALRKRGLRIIEVTGDSVLFSLMRKNFRFSDSELDFLKKIDKHLISMNPNVAEHLIIVARKI